MREVIRTPNAPAAIGAYSQAIRVNGLVYTSGQLPIDPKTGKLVEGDIKAQTQQVMKNIAAILRAAGTSMRHAVKVTVYLRNLSDFAGMNEVYAEWLNPEKPPARSTVPGVDLPMGALVEIDVVAGIYDMD
ncbi:MAG: RidA family protein [Anaerolineae bacterium]